MRKYVYAQMLLDIMTAMKRPTSELKATARSWLAHGSTVPDILTDGSSYNEMVSPDVLKELHAFLVDKPVGKIRGKAAEVAAWIAEEEDFETWKDLPRHRPKQTTSAARDPIPAGPPTSMDPPMIKQFRI